MNMFFDEYPSGERRKFKRLPFKEAVQYNFRETNDIGGCLACDIGEGGIRLTVPDFIPIETELGINILFSNPSKVADISGRVAWIQRIPSLDRYQIGLTFTNNDSEIQARKMIAQYVNAQSGQDQEDLNPI